jgi:hypothetical protein
VILQSDCGTFWWRVVEQRTWIPGYYAWINGCNAWVDGYWSWRVVRKEQIWDYDYHSALPPQSSHPSPSPNGSGAARGASFGRHLIV